MKNQRRILRLKSLVVRYNEPISTYLSVSLLLLLFNIWPIIHNFALLIDGDVFFHFQISKQLAETFSLTTTLPQLPFLGWDTNFVDKEFLFHMLTTIGHFFALDNGVIWIGKILSNSIIILLFFLCKRISGNVHKSSFLILFFVLSNYIFLIRLNLLRPHLLAILCSLFILFSILEKKPWLLFTSNLLFALSYHAFYIPLILMSSIFLDLLFAHKKPQTKNIVLGLSGLLIGIVINPYFPGTITSSITHIFVAFRALDIPSYSIPLEVRAWSPFQFLLIYGHIFLFAILLKIYSKTKHDSLKSFLKNNSPLLLPLTIFICLSFVSKRAIEYLTPLSVLFFAQHISHATNRFFKISILLCTVSLIISFSSKFDFIHPNTYKVPLKLLSHIPHDKPTAIFNCNWDTGSYILHSRPNATFISILDPSFLYLQNKKLFKKYYEIIEGKTNDPIHEIKNHFSSDYILCRTPALNKQLKALLQPIAFHATTEEKYFLWKLK